MKKTILFFTGALLWISCKEQMKSPDASLVKEAIQQVMDEQEAAWNQGDLEGFMQGYWKSDSLRFIGKRGITYGWQPTLDNYKQSYPDSDAMGKLQFTNLSMEITGDSSTYVIGKWELFRTTDTLAGHYSLLWKNLNGRWLIIADHSS
jgi:ketosteroid isomerase-like protein